MAASEIEQWWIDKFQENLGPIRKVAGWTTQQLADELGVARQTVSNLETGRWEVKVEPWREFKRPYLSNGDLVDVVQAVDPHLLEYYGK